MKTNRTFGVEIECHSKYDRYEIASRLNVALKATPITFHHRAVATGWGQRTDETNTTRWDVTTDISVGGTGGRLVPDRVRDAGFIEDMEIVSPVLKGKKGLAALKVVLEALDGIVDVSHTCGLHVHHGVKYEPSERVKNVMNSWIKCEKHFMKVLPPSRLTNSFCETWREKCDGQLRPITLSKQIRSWWRETFECYADDYERFVTLNMASYMLRGTLEYRMHSGTVEYEKISNWLRMTQAYTEKALNDDVIPHDDFEEFVKQFNGIASTFDELRVPKNIKRKKSRGYIMAEMLMDGCYSKEEILDKLYEELPHQKHSTYFDDYLCWFKSHRVDDLYTGRAPSWDIRKDPLGKYYIFNFDPEASHKENEEFVEWMLNRKALFANN